MSKLPIEICVIGKVNREDVNIAISIANSIQSQFLFERLEPSFERRFNTLNFRKINTDHFIQKAKGIKNKLPGYHPFIIIFTDSDLESNRWTNLFSDRDSKIGIAISTSKGVPGLIIPKIKMTSYFLYYLGRHTLNFIVPNHFNHPETRECVYDFMEHKKDILLSMKENALCDECRKSLSNSTQISPEQLESLDIIFNKSGEILKNKKKKEIKKLKVFIGSSVEGLKYAREIRRQLGNGYEIDIWEKDTVFGLGKATIESLEDAVKKYDIGIFVFTPDDELITRKSKKPVARDNVIFETGLFIGKLSRFKSFIVQPSKNRVVLPSDLKGMITAIYEYGGKILSDKVRPAVKKIRNTLKSIEIKK